MVLAALVWSLALLGLAVWTSVAAAFLLFALAGSARTLLDVAARTLLQRTATSNVLARVFGLLETLDCIGLAAGALLAPALVGLLGAQAAVAGLALVLPLLLVLAGRRLRGNRRERRRARGGGRPAALVRAFEALGATALEDLARRLIPVPVRAGERVIEEGLPGRRYYVVAHGSLEIASLRLVATLGRGEGIGEISLLAGLPHTATATAGEAGLLYALDAEPFIEVMNDAIHAPGRIRTCDLCLRRGALYPLSYGRQHASVDRPWSSPSYPIPICRAAARRLPQAFVERIRGADLLLHAGDFMTLAVLRELEAIGPPVLGVYGNVDSAELCDLLPAERVVEAGGARIAHAPRCRSARRAAGRA